MELDSNFEQLLAQENQKFKEAKEFDDFTPPPGTYPMILEEIDTGTYTDNKTGNEVMRVNPALKVIDDNNDAVDGRTCRPFFSSKAWGPFKTFAREALGGELAGELKENVQALEEKIGTVYEVQVEQNGNFTNYHILRELPTETAETEPQAENANA